MKALKFSLMLMLLAFCLPMTSCGDDDDEPTPVLPSNPGSVSTGITVENGSSNTLGSFTVIFTTEGAAELISARDFGTLYPNSSINAEIPTGAEEYYFMTKVNGEYYYSASYKVSTTYVKLTNQTIWY